MARSLDMLKYVALFSLCVLTWLVFEDVMDVRLRILKTLPPSRTRLMSNVSYEQCTKIPSPPPGKMWPEENFIYDRKITDLAEIAEPSNALVWIDGKSEVTVGDTVHVSVLLYDGYGKRKLKGGDLVRVWMKEETLGASSSAHVLDNNDGSYTATLTAFWEGNPYIRVAIISPREVIATVFRRRYLCPSVLMNTGVFKHPSDPNIVEETPCDYDPQIPGYTAMCNFTGENFNSPWYCGKPTTPGLLCHDWTEIADMNLWLLGYDQTKLSAIEQEMVSLKYKAMEIPTNLVLQVKKGNQSRLIVNKKCNKVNKEVTWYPSIPSGYLYDRKWTALHCSGVPSTLDYTSCLRNTRVVMIGDSTVRQLFSALQRKVPCDWLTGAGMDNLKHRPAICVNKELNYELQMEEHTLPFCTRDTPRTYLKTFRAHLENIPTDRRTILVLHGFAHFLNHHSHVFIETLKNMKKGVVDLLQRHPNVFIVIKGPHTFSFAKNPEAVMWMPDKYAEEYHKIILEMFSDLRDKVMYLECQSITISSEQWHIHAEDYIIDNLIGNIFSHACSY